MKVILASHAGFCQGVKGAVELALKSAAARDGLLCTLGPLVHNHEVVKYLQSKGVQVFTDLEQIPVSSTVIIRTHGVGPDTYELLEKNSCKVIDATCSIVKHVQKIVAREANRGKQIIIVGDPEHPEVVGLKGWAGDNFLVVNSQKGFPLEEIQQEAVVVAQTTISSTDFFKVVELIIEEHPKIKVYNTICKAALLRQKAAVKLARLVDLMIVIGGTDSSNTQKLTSLCRGIGIKTYQIVSPEEIHSITGWAGVRIVGVTAGASTPDWTIKEVIGKMVSEQQGEQVQEEQVLEEEMTREIVEQTEQKGKTQEQGQEVVEPAELAQEEPAVEGKTLQGEQILAVQEESVQEEQIEQEEEAQEELAPGEDIYAEDIKSFEIGQMVKGKVVQVSQEQVLVDLGYKTEGVLPITEVFLKSGETLVDVIKPEDELDLVVKFFDDEEANLILSKKGLDREKTWADLTEALENKTTIKAMVKEVNQAGIIIDLGSGLEGFMPGSLVDIKFIPDFKEFIGKEVEFRVIEINREKVKAILSRKAVLEDEKESIKKHILENLQAGEIITGEVKRLTDFGAFVDVGGIDGLVHISEISWKRIGHPRDVMKVGEEVQVKVLEVIPEKERIGLSLRQAQPDPWSLVAEKFSTGEIVDGKVTRLVNFGAFVELLVGVEGLVHISQIADYHVKHPSEVLEENQDIKVKILDINVDSKRISLSVKKTQETKPKQPSKPQNVMIASTDNDSNGGVTFGDVFGELGELGERLKNETKE